MYGEPDQFANVGGGGRGSGGEMECGERRERGMGGGRGPGRQTERE